MPAAASDDGGKRDSGFRGQIKGASLGDLVQMECLAGSRRIVRVASGSNTGYLYFRGGGVVHAITRSLVGEAAAMEMLKWNDGTFESVEREWPLKETISTSWQTLLLRAAHLRDENHQQSVVALRGDARTRNESILAPDVEQIEFEVTPLDVAGHVLRSEDFDLAVRLSPRGVVIASRGESEGLADAVAYACRLTEILGELLGFGRFVAMECSFKNGRFFVVCEDSGEVVALSPCPTTDLDSIRDLFGL